MIKSIIKTEKRARRHRKIRSRISGSATVPRLTVFKSNKFMYAQLIDDEKNVTLASASSSDFDKKVKNAAAEVGKSLAEKASAKGIKKVVFDRSGYVYGGKVKALADGAREGGLKF